MCDIGLGNTSHVKQVNVALYSAYSINELMRSKMLRVPKTNYDIKAFSRQGGTCTIDIILDRFNLIGNSPGSLIKIKRILHLGLKLLKLVPDQCIAKTDTFSSCSSFLLKLKVNLIVLPSLGVQLCLNQHNSAAGRFGERVVASSFLNLVGSCDGHFWPGLSGPSIDSKNKTTFSLWRPRT